VKLVECWRWRYRDPQGRVWRTTLPLTREEASKYPGAERMEGTMTVRDMDRARQSSADPDWVKRPDATAR
jgi:hypothetical protein